MFGGADPLDRRPGARRHRDCRQPLRETAAMEGRRPALRGRGVGGEEPVRAQERAPRARRGQPLRIQLAARAERLRDSVYGAQSGRRRAVVGGRGRHVPRQRGPSRRRPASTSSATTTFIRAVGPAASRFVDNVFADVGGAWGHGRLFQVLDGTRDVVIDHNTAFQTGTPLFGGDARPHTGFVFQQQHRAGRHGRHLRLRHAAGRLATLDRYFPAPSSAATSSSAAMPSSFPGQFLSRQRSTTSAAAPAAHGDGFSKLAARYAGGRHRWHGTREPQPQPARR